MRHKVIVNPVAGEGHGSRVAPRIERLLSEQGLDFDLVMSNWAGETVELARQAVLDGYDTVVAAGGDGTYHEAINGMMAASNGDVVGTLGVLPVGSGCDFAYMVGVSSNLEEACAQLVRRETRVVEVAR